MLDSILVARLARYYDPFSFLFGKTYEELPNDFFRVKPIKFVDNLGRPICSDYDRRRIAFFAEKLERREMIDPIEVDNDIPPHHGGPPVWGPPIIADGHHRTCAAILAGRRRIACTYSGLVDTLDWLKGEGRADRPPFDY